MKEMEKTGKRETPKSLTGGRGGKKSGGLPFLFP